MMPISIVGAVQQKKITVGKQVTIKAQQSGTFKAQIAAIDGEKLLLHGKNSTVEKLKELCENDEVLISFVVPDDAIYSFKASVLNLQREMVEVKQLAALERREQRSDYRLKTAKIIYMLAEQPDSPLGQSWHKACLLDLSRGGASILTAIDLPEGTEISVWIPLEEVDHVLEVTAKVVRLQRGEEGQSLMGVSFTDLSLLDQEKILDYILKVWTEKLNNQQPQGK